MAKEITALQERITLSTVITLIFLLLNLLIRATFLIHVFPHSIPVGLFLGAFVLCCILVVVYPEFLKHFLFLFGFSFFLFGFHSFDIHNFIFEFMVTCTAVTILAVNLRTPTPTIETQERSFFENTRRSLKNSQSWSRSRKAKISAAGIYAIFRGLKFESDTEIGRERPFFKDLLRLLLFCYIALSASSLLLLPLDHIAKSLWLFGLQGASWNLFAGTANTIFYPVAAVNRLVLFTLLALQLARTKDSIRIFKWLFAGIFTGAVFCALIGLLDFFGVISLQWYRAATVAVPNTLHSTFLNRGWFAEFIMTVVPFVLLGFMSKIRGLWWKVLLLCILVILELALILAGARAGWVSYPLILFICWGFFYFSKEGKLDTSRIGWKGLAKVAVSVPITIGISLVLISQFILSPADKPENRKQPAEKSALTATSTDSQAKASTQHLKSQVRDLFLLRHRTTGWKIGLDVGRERPLFGVGYESYNMHANILSEIPGSPYYQTTTSIYKGYNPIPIFDTPHNIFVQLFVSNGIAGLLLWLSIIGYALVILIRDLVTNRNLLNIPVLISIISFHMYGIFQSMQYIPVIWLLIFLNLGYALTVRTPELSPRHRIFWKTVSRVAIVLVIIAPFVYFHNFGSKALARKYDMETWTLDPERDNFLGFYNKEDWGGQPYRWTGRKGLIRLHGNGTAHITIHCTHPDILEKPVIINVSLDGDPVDTIVFEDKGSVKRSYPLQGGANQDHRLLFNVSRTWSPKRHGINFDTRDLGIAVSVNQTPKDRRSGGREAEGRKIGRSGGRKT